MKREIAEIVSNCGICQQVKIEHQKPTGKLQLLSVSRMEMGGYLFGFCDRITQGKER
jgi:hypothetical protein